MRSRYDTRVVSCMWFILHGGELTHLLVICVAGMEERGVWFLDESAAVHRASDPLHRHVARTRDLVSTQMLYKKLKAEKALEADPDRTQSLGRAMCMNGILLDWISTNDCPLTE